MAASRAPAGPYGRAPKGDGGLNSRACLRILNSRACLRILSMAALSVEHLKVMAALTVEHANASSPSPLPYGRAPKGP